MLASVETLAAALFLWPRTLRLGAAVLTAVFAVAFLAHAWRGQFPGALLEYAAGASSSDPNAGPGRRELS